MKIKPESEISSHITLMIAITTLVMSLRSTAVSTGHVPKNIIVKISRVE